MMKTTSVEALKEKWQAVQKMLDEAKPWDRDGLLLERDAIKRQALAAGYDCYTIYHW